MRRYAETTPYVGGAVGLLRGVTSLGSTPFRAVNTASDAVAQALPFEATSGVASEGAIAFGENVDLGVYAANNKVAVANAIKDRVIDTSSRTFFDGDGAYASDFVSGVTQFAVPAPSIATGLTAFRVTEAPSGSLVLRHDTDAEAGSEFTQHPTKVQLIAGPAPNSPGSGMGLLPGEGDVGTFDDLIGAGQKGDNITPHHIPSARHMAQHGVSRGDGISINMEQPSPGAGGRHRRTFTYGTTADLSMTSRQAMAAGVWDARKVYKQDGLYRSLIRQKLRELIEMNKSTHPELFKKGE